MDWDYFNQDGVFKAKKLPRSSKTVRIKDVTDLSDLRDYLKDADDFKSGIECYNHCFSDYWCYDVEVETFDEFCNRNPGNFLGDLSKLKGKFDLIEELLENTDDPDGDNWIHVEAPIGKQLVKCGLVDLKLTIDADDWWGHLESLYTKPEMVALGAKHSLHLKGSKSKVNEGLCEAIESGLFKHKAPFLVKPNSGLKQWHEGMQVKYLDQLDIALAEVEYPPNFVRAVIREVKVEGPSYPHLASEMNERYEGLFPQSEPDTGPPEVDSKTRESNGIGTGKIIFIVVVAGVLLWTFFS